MTHQSVLADLQAGGRLPSVVAGVLRGGELAWTGSAGDVASTDVQYRIGSITKTLVAVTVWQLHDEGLLGLEDPVGRWIPESGYATVAVCSLLSHTSGMQSEPVGPWWERTRGGTFEELSARNDGSGAVAAPGEYFHYSNLGFALLGELVARARDSSWWDVVRTRVLDPLGMLRTTYEPQAPHAQGYSVDHFANTLTPEPHQDTGAMAPAGQVWSTVADLARYAAFLVAGHADVLPGDSISRATTLAAADGEYGLGFRVVSRGGRTMVGHTGSMPGFQASLFVDRADGDGVVALTNATTGLPTEAVPWRFLAGDGDRGAAGAEITASWTPSDEVPAGVRELLGLWFWGNTAFEFRWNRDHLAAHALGERAESYTFAERGEHFRGRDGYHRGETLRVHRRSDGTVSHLECATFVYTRTPYDRDVPIPGGHPG